MACRAYVRQLCLRRELVHARVRDTFFIYARFPFTCQERFSRGSRQRPLKISPACPKCFSKSHAKNNITFLLILKATLTRFFSNFGSMLASFWLQFRFKIGSKIDVKMLMRFSSLLERLGAPPRAKESEKERKKNLS